MLLWRIVNHKFLESRPGVSHLGTKLFISLPYQPCHRPSFLSTLSLTSLFTSLSCLSSTFYQHAIVLVIDLLSTRRLPRLTPKRSCYSTRRRDCQTAVWETTSTKQDHTDSHFVLTLKTQLASPTTACHRLHCFAAFLPPPCRLKVQNTLNYLFGLSALSFFDFSKTGIYNRDVNHFYFILVSFLYVLQMIIKSQPKSLRCLECRQFNLIGICS